MEVFCGVHSETTDQHVDMGPSRVARDNSDIKKLSNWLADLLPFPKSEELMSIISGTVAQENVNCYLARSVGITCMKTCLEKGRKSMMYEAFSPIKEQLSLGTRICNVIDGGYLLHKVVWSKANEATFQVVCQIYVYYVKRHFGSNAILVFDGYPVGINYQSTKAAERYRRSLLHSSTKFIFTETTFVSTISQAKFLSNEPIRRTLLPY